MLDVFAIRPATFEDVGVICEHRRCMFQEMGYGPAELLDRMASSFEPWLRRRMQAGEYLGWLAIDQNGSVAGGLGLWLMDWPPHVLGPGSSQRGNILNVYTSARSRRKGIARELMTVALEYCRANQIGTVILHASEDGRMLYEQLGFKPTNEMRTVLDV